MKLRAGELNRRITIERKSVALDEQNAPIETWAALASNVPAAFRPVSGTDEVQGNEQSAQVRAEFWLRFKAGITTEDRIDYQGRKFDILDVVEINFREGLRLPAIERRRTES